MNTFARNLNAIVAIAAREVMKFLRTPMEIGFTFIFPVIFMGILGGSLVENLGEGVEFNLLQFILFGIVVATLYQTMISSVASLIEDRENDFTQEMFVAPISRYALILGKIIGGTITSLFSLIGVFVVAFVMQIPLTLEDIGRVVLMWPIICIAGGALGILFISLVRDPGAVDTGVLLIVFPQMFLSGILTPISESSGALGVISHLMPLTYLVDLMRNVVYVGSPYYGDIVLYNPIVDLVITVAVSVVCIIAGTLLFTHSERTR